MATLFKFLPYSVEGRDFPSLLRDVWERAVPDKRIWQGKRAWKSGEVPKAQESSADWSLWKKDPVPLWMPPVTSKSNTLK